MTIDDNDDDADDDNDDEADNDDDDDDNDDDNDDDDDEKIHKILKCVTKVPNRIKIPRRNHKVVLHQNVKT